MPEEIKLVLVDTNVVSFIFRGHRQAKGFLEQLKGKILHVSFQTVGELYEWAENNRWGEERRNRLVRVLGEHYTVIPVDDHICLEWARVRAERRRIGRSISESDAWIAASARRYEMALATDDSDFSGIKNLDLVTFPRTP